MTLNAILPPSLPSGSAPQSQLDSKQDREPEEVVPWLPCTLVVDIPVRKFTVHNLMSLDRGTIVETDHHQSSDVPLHVNHQLVGWIEFEVVGDRLAVRLTDLS